MPRNRRDLHTDQLSQAVLLEFAESGRLAAHRARMLEAGAERLAATLEACREHLPAGTRWTRPQGGMNVWVRLPEPLDAARASAARAEGRRGLSAGPVFRGFAAGCGRVAVEFCGADRRSEIRQGLAILGRIFAGELRSGVASSFEPAPAHGLTRVNV